MMNIETIKKIAGFLNSDLLWLYFGLVILAFYLLIALFTRSIKRPLNFIGIPTLIAGMLLILFYFMIDIVPLPLSEALMRIILTSVKPILNVGIICLVMGTVMIVSYKIISKKNKRNNIESNEPKKESQSASETTI